MVWSIDRMLNVTIYSAKRSAAEPSWVAPRSKHNFSKITSRHWTSVSPSCFMSGNNYKRTTTKKRTNILAHFPTLLVRSWLCAAQETWQCSWKCLWAAWTRMSDCPWELHWTQFTSSSLAIRCLPTLNGLCRYVVCESFTVYAAPGLVRWMTPRFCLLLNLQPH